MTWAIYYEDGTRFTSEDGEPWQSPPWGAVLIAQDAPGMETLNLGLDYFIWRADLGQWLNVDGTGLLDQLVNLAQHVRAVRPGRYIASPSFKAIVLRAKEDRRAPR